MKNILKKFKHKNNKNQKKIVKIRKNSKISKKIIKKRKTVVKSNYSQLLKNFWSRFYGLKSMKLEL